MSDLIVSDAVYAGIFAGAAVKAMQFDSRLAVGQRVRVRAQETGALGEIRVLKYEGLQPTRSGAVAHLYQVQRVAALAFA